MKKIILYCVLFFAFIVETSCGGRVQNTVSEKPAHEDKVKEMDTKQKQVIKESLNITFEDALGNRQKLKTEEVDKNDVGAKLCDESIGCFVKDNHFYYKVEMPFGTENVYMDKGKKLGEFDLKLNDWTQNWGIYRGKLYLVLRSDAELFNEKQTVKFMSVDLDSWKTKTINCSAMYEDFLDVFVYNEKIYINDLYHTENLDEIDMNGKKIRTIALGKEEDKIHLQGIMNGEIYYSLNNGNQFMLKSKALETGKERKLLQYEQPEYDKKKLKYQCPYFRMSGNNLFIMDEFYEKNKEINYEPKYNVYWFPIKDNGKIKRVCNKKIVDCDFSEDDIFYIDDKHVLHRKNLKKGADKVISKRKLEKVTYTKEGLFVNKYKEREAYDEDAVEEDVIYYMDFDGEHEKKIAEI